jgi:hypothetical protein
MKSGLYPHVYATLGVKEEPGSIVFMVNDIEWKNEDIIRVGREHLLDAVYTSLTQRVYGSKIKERRKILYRSMEMDEIELNPDSLGNITLMRDVVAGDYTVTLTAYISPDASRADVDQFFHSLLVQI